MIAPDKRKALFLLHQQGLSIRQIVSPLNIGMSRHAACLAVHKQHTWQSKYASDHSS